MGKHRTQEQKLKDAHAVLAAGGSIANRDIRRILGADYAAYEQALREARAENNQFKKPERTRAQREAEQAIKLALMHMQRGTEAADVLMERAEELVQELDAWERNEIACWGIHPDTKKIEIDWQYILQHGIYIDSQSAQPVDELKRNTLREFIQATLEERFGYQAKPALDTELLRAKLAALKTDY